MNSNKVESCCPPNIMDLLIQDPKNVEMIQHPKTCVVAFYLNINPPWVSDYTVRLHSNHVVTSKQRKITCPTAPKHTLCNEAFLFMALQVYFSCFISFIPSHPRYLYPSQRKPPTISHTIPSLHFHCWPNNSSKAKCSKEWMNLDS